MAAAHLRLAQLSPPISYAVCAGVNSGTLRTLLQTLHLHPALRQPPLLQLSCHKVRAAVPFSTSAKRHQQKAPYRSAPIRNWVTSHRMAQYKNKKGQKDSAARSLVQIKQLPIGDRKRFRHRTQITNDNALPGRAAGQLLSNTMLSPQSAGQVFAVPQELLDPLRELRAFRPTQSWSLFQSPHTLIRHETIRLMSRLQPVFQHGKSASMIIHGGPGTGKSVLALQAIVHAKLNKCVVINIPSAQDLILNHSAYSPILQTNPVQLSQTDLTKRLVESIAFGNLDLLDKYKTTREYRFDIARLPPNSPLSAFPSVITESENAWPVFLALWHELAVVPHRAPILFILEGLDHLMGLSHYRDPNFNPVHSFELALPRFFLSCLSGRPISDRETMPTFVNGAAFVATTGGNNSPRVPAFEFAIAQRLAAAAGAPIPALDPYNKSVHDERVRGVVDDLDVLRIGPVSRDEARAVMDYWASSGVMRSAVTEDTVARQCALSGGVMFELVRSALDTAKV